MPPLHSKEPFLRRKGQRLAKFPEVVVLSRSSTLSPELYIWYTVMLTQWPPPATAESIPLIAVINWKSALRSSVSCGMIRKGGHSSSVDGRDRRNSQLFRVCFDYRTKAVRCLHQRCKTIICLESKMKTPPWCAMRVARRAVHGLFLIPFFVVHG